MKKEFWKENASKFLFILVVAVLVCAVVLLFFEPDIPGRAVSTILYILTPFIYGFAIAYILRPFALRLEKLLARLFKKRKTGNGTTMRLISSLITLVLLLVVLILILVLVVPQLVESISNIVASLPDAVERFESWLTSLDQGPKSHAAVEYVTNLLETISTKLKDFLETSALPVLESITSSVMDVVNVLKNFGLGCIISIYFMCSWEKFMAQLKLVIYSLFPQKAADWIKNELKFADQMFSGFIIGKIVDSALVGVLCFIFCALTKMPYAALISILIGVTNMIPFFGQFLGAIPATILILTESLPKAIIFVIFIIILMQVDGNIIGPKILGNKLGISSFWILFSILFFGALWGIIGMLIGSPLMAILYDLIRKGVYKALNARNQKKLAQTYSDQFH